jgi:RimJ/RimL family protein N-acetyltransferase
LYSFDDSIHKVSVGYRLSEKFWGRGIASEALKMMIDYLYTNTDIEIITASTLPDNQASAEVLRKNGFDLVVHNSPEDWGYEAPLPTDKWIR